MSILPIELLAPVAQLGRAAGTAAVAAGSGFAGLLKNALNSSDTAAPAGGTSVGPAAASTGSVSRLGSEANHLTEYRGETDKLLKSFQLQLMQTLALNGVDVSGGVHLQLDEFGQVRVAGNHPQKHAIEGLLASHPELEDAFRAVATRSAALRQLDQNQHPELLDASPVRVDLFVDADRTEVTFVPAAA